MFQEGEDQALSVLLSIKKRRKTFVMLLAYLMLVVNGI